MGSSHLCDTKPNAKVSSYFALLDCNNFYVSCERVFNPSLEGRPVVVLSNNDGCIISRSAEAKSIGIKMGAPLFKCKEVIKRHKVKVFSSNYPLYGDMSKRVVEVLRRFNYPLEVYSIDEVFIELPVLAEGQISEIGREMRQRVLQCVGIPISVGVSYTKTLAKVANRRAKTSGDGVCTLLTDDALESALAETAVGDVWGIGRRLSAKLNAKGIVTAKELRDVDERRLSGILNVVGFRTVSELRRSPCLSLELGQADSKSIVCSRSFRRKVSKLSELEEAIATYTARAAQKLRRQQLEVLTLSVYLVTDRFRMEEPCRSCSANLAKPTSDSSVLISQAKRNLAQIFVSGKSYAKAGVAFTTLSSASRAQGDLFSNSAKEQSGAEIMKQLDLLNRKWGRGSVYLAAEGVEKRWSMRQEKLSRKFTTSWEEILVARLS